MIYIKEYDFLYLEIRLPDYISLNDTEVNCTLIVRHRKKAVLN